MRAERGSEMCDAGEGGAASAFVAAVTAGSMVDIVPCGFLMETGVFLRGLRKYQCASGIAVGSSPQSICCYKCLQDPASWR